MKREFLGSVYSHFWCFFCHTTRISHRTVSTDRAGKSCFRTALLWLLAPFEFRPRAESGLKEVHVLHTQLLLEVQWPIVLLQFLLAAVTAIKGRVLQKVPATSVAPTYKLTLPAEVVCEALPHLIEKDFELVDTTGQHVWSVSILPRKNKDKFEYTLQVFIVFYIP